MNDTQIYVKDVLSRMSAKEKALALTGESTFKFGSREKIPAIYFLDGGTGANYAQMVTGAFYRLNQTGSSCTDELINATSSVADKMLRLMHIGLGGSPQRPNRSKQKPIYFRN